MKCSPVILVLAVLLAIMSFQSVKGQQLTTQSGFPGRKVLIVYLSRTNNTKAIAQIIGKQTRGALVELVLQKPYPENYQATVSQVAKENETGYLPLLKTKINDIQKYEVIFLGFPTWGMQLPPPMKSFLHQYNLQGKTVIPFNTNAGYGIGSTFQTVKELCLNSKILDGFSMKGGVERDGQLLVIKGQTATKAETEVKKWLAKLAPAISDNGK